MEILEQIDIALFYFINVSLQNSFFDWFMPFITHKQNWFPVWGILIILLLWKGGRKGRIAVLLIIPVIFLSDQLSSHVIKPLFARSRPCIALTDVHLLLNRKTSFSFTSSHAANFFAVAAYFNYYYPKYGWVYFSLATLVGLSRIFVGVHYPFDVIFGAFLGIICAYTVIFSWNIVNKKVIEKG
jgi:undecaprenyl-diphosphatase